MTAEPREMSIVEELQNPVAVSMMLLPSKRWPQSTIHRRSFLHFLIRMWVRMYVHTYVCDEGVYVSWLKCTVSAHAQWHDWDL